MYVLLCNLDDRSGSQEIDREICCSKPHIALQQAKWDEQWQIKRIKYQPPLYDQDDHKYSPSIQIKCCKLSVSTWLRGQVRCLSPTLNEPWRMDIHLRFVTKRWRKQSFFFEENGSSGSKNGSSITIWSVNDDRETSRTTINSLQIRTSSNDGYTFNLVELEGCCLLPASSNQQDHQFGCVLWQTGPIKQSDPPEAFNTCQSSGHCLSSR